MGLESYKQLNIDFINKLIKNEHSRSNLEELSENSEDNRNELEDEEDLSKLESKVDIYLSKIKELDSFLSEDEEDKLKNTNKYERINGKIREFVNLEKEHQSGPYNRHIYFAGIPLRNSLEVLNNLKVIKSQKEQILRLEEEVKRVKEELAELTEEKKVNFERFEVSIQKALKLGLGLQILVSSFNNFNLRRLRLFFARLRSLNHSQLRNQVPLLILTPFQVNKLSSFKALSLVYVLNNLIKSRLYTSFYLLKFLGSHSSSYSGNNKLLVKDNPLHSYNKLLDSNNKLVIKDNSLNMDLVGNVKLSDNSKLLSDYKDNGEDMEKNLLNRLERLLIEEINMLS